MPERGFLIFWISLLFCLEFSLPGSSMSGIWNYDFFFLFLSLSNIVLARNIARKRFFNFLNFFAIFFGIFLPGSSLNGIRDKIFFIAFSAYLIPFWLKIMPERGFLIFLIFFSEFSCPGQVWTEFGTKIFFSLSQPISSCFG